MHSLRASSRRAVRWIFIMGITAVVLVTGATEAAAAGDLRVEATTTYRLVPASERIEVTIELVLTNQRPSTTSGNVITSFYFDEYITAIPDDAVDINASDDTGESLGVSTDATENEDGMAATVVTIGLPRQLLYQQTQRLTLEFALPGGEPRTRSTVRANPAYAAFIAGAWGDPGLAAVEIRIPDDFDVEYNGSTLATGVGSTDQTWSRSEIAEPQDWRVFFTARNDSALVAERVDVHGVEITAESWPGDDVWLDRVVQVIERGLPQLRDAIGLELAGDRSIRVVEALDPSLLGYAGWYLVGESAIELGEDLDDHVTLHELSHLWFNDVLFAGRWITEGLAEEYAADAVAAIGGQADPGRAGSDRPITSGDGAVPLNDWVFPYTAPARDEETASREEYGYNASYYVVDRLDAEIGDEAMREILRAAARDEIAYRDGAEPETVSPEDDWRRLLDLAQEIGGSVEVEGLFREFVVTDGQLDELDERTAARDAYLALLEADGTWVAPLAVRRPMAQWEFDEARDAMVTATQVVDARDDTAQLAESAGLAPPASLRARYEDSTDAGGLQRALDAARLGQTAISELIRARTALDRAPGVVARIGLWGADLEPRWDRGGAAFELGAHRTAIHQARIVLHRLGDASRVGWERVKWTAIALAGVAFGSAASVIIVRRWRRR